MSLFKTASRHSLGISMVCLSAVMWSSAGFFVRMLDMNTWAMVAWRSLFAFLSLVLLLALGGYLRRFAFRHDVGIKGLITAAVMAVSMFCYVAALKLTSVAGVMTVYATIPFFAMGLGWLIQKKKITKRALISAALSLVGVIVMATSASGTGDMAGNALALMMTAGFAASIVMSGTWPDMNLPAVTALACALCGAFCFTMMPQGLPLPGLHDMVWLCAFALATQSLSYLLFMAGSRYINPAEASLIAQTDIVLGPLWVWIFFSELPPSNTLLGGAITFIAVTGYLAGEYYLKTRAASKN
ncbi:DMT family transporter [Pantoea stewartii subsp. indologenes]|uniref:DMT family transporter n=1 Tax=Pantoea stewartii TaxID=66269 RepID=UPI00197E27C7|nr:DMT family transporter [Pantoea stewartii]MDK2632205.1 DMT family transporter [Pantoea stewartii subsp. indologenes]